MQTRLFELSFACAALIYFSGPAWAQVSSADVNIVSLTGSSPSASRFVCEAVINNQNDDDAYGVTVVMLLPLQVQKADGQVLGGPGICKPYPNSNGPYIETMICDLGHLPQGPTVRRTVRVTMTPSTAGPNYPPTCGAFIYSTVGDIDKRNNYAYWPCDPTYQHNTCTKAK